MVRGLWPTLLINPNRINEVTSKWTDELFCWCVNCVVLRRPAAEEGPQRLQDETQAELGRRGPWQGPQTPLTLAYLSLSLSGPTPGRARKGTLTTAANPVKI
ncbi:unnamed protein product [Boreogadus saida]